MIDFYDDDDFYDEGFNDDYYDDQYDSEYEEIIEKYNELRSWEKVAEHFSISKKIIQRLRKLNE